LCLPAYRYQT